MNGEGKKISWVLHSIRMKRLKTREKNTKPLGLSRKSKDRDDSVVGIPHCDFVKSGEEGR